MKKSDYAKLAQQYANAAMIGANDNVLISLHKTTTAGKRLAEACKTHALSLGASVFIAEIKTPAEELIQMRKDKGENFTFSKFISINDGYLPQDLTHYTGTMWDASEHLDKNIEFLVVNSPTKEFAKVCCLSQKEMDDFYLKVCLLDYRKMAKAVIPLKELMDRTEKVRITGPGTDLSFSIKGLKSQPCIGEKNIPDGECFTAPQKFSVNGNIAFGSSFYHGIRFSRIDLKYTDGYITCARAGDAEETKELNRILDSDPGARFTGEFAIAFNPYITRAVGDILFDEKQAKSIHIAQGNSYTGVADNGNRSSVHWDMVHSQAPENGGGRIWFDDKIIRQDGHFILPELEALNPENLI